MDNDIPKTIGGRIKYIRKREDIGQKELASKVGISARRLGDYESGKNRPNDLTVIATIAKELNISLDFIFGLTDDIISFSQKNCVMLPKDFSTDDIPKVKEYIIALDNLRKDKNS